MPTILIYFFILLHLLILSNLKPAFKSFHDYLTKPCEEPFLISSCTKKEILEIISSFENNKATRINSTPTKTLKLAKERIAEHLCFIYNMSFTTGIKSHQFTKRVLDLSDLTIDPFLCYQILIK